MSLFVFSSSWCNWKAVIYVCGSYYASSLLCLYSATLSVLYITTKQATEYVWPCFIRIPEATLGLDRSRCQWKRWRLNCAILAIKQQKCRTVDPKQQQTAYTLISCDGEELSDWKVV